MAEVHHGYRNRNRKERRWLCPVLEADETHMHAGGDVLLSFVTRRTQVQNVGRAEQEQGRQHSTGEQAAQHSMQEAGNQGGSWSWAAGSCTAGRSTHGSSAGRVQAGKGAEHRQMLAHREKRRMQEGAGGKREGLGPAALQMHGARKISRGLGGGGAVLI